MGTYSIHIIESSVCLAVFYVVYLLFLRNDIGFKFIRYYLLAALIISTLLPFNNFSVRFSKSIATIEKTELNIADSKYLEKDSKTQYNQLTSHHFVSTVSKQSGDYYLYVKWIYFTILTIVVLRLFIGVCAIFLYYKQSLKDIRGNVVILKNEKLNYSFSFFNFIFINPSGLNENELQSIIAHENIHISQHHTIDLILIELLSAVMWFNPIVWLMRKSLRQVHEYLADEGVLNNGFDRLEYQALLVNQVAESRLLSLASSFNQSLIKKRIIMMTKLKSNNKTKVKLWILAPVALLLFLGVSYVNGTNNTNTNKAGQLLPPTPSKSIISNDSVVYSNAYTKVSLNKLRVLYIGIDNRVEITVAGYKKEELFFKIDQGSISRENGIYIINVAKGPTTTVVVSVNNKVVKEEMFRVKTIPNPV